MKTKKYSILLVVIALSSVATACFAGPRGGSNWGRDYVVASQGLDPWSAGLYYHNREREVQVQPSRVPTLMKISEILVYAGFDLRPWWTVYASIGESKAKFGASEYDDGEMAYGFGTQFNLFDHEIEDPFLLEDRVRINAGGEYVLRETESAWRGNLEWQELTGYLTVSIVNDVQADKMYYPDSIAVFAGPMYSDILGDDIKTPSSDSFGYMVGLEVFCTKRLSLHVSMEAFEENGYSAGVNLCF